MATWKQTLCLIAVLWLCNYANAQTCTDGTIRLVGGTTNLEGRVEVCSSGAWGTVCDDSWDINDAMVACRQLGFGAAINAVSFAGFGQGTGNIVLEFSHNFTNLILYLATSAPGLALFGQGTGDIVLDDLACAGTESSLFDCTHNAVHNCAHSEDAGVVCSVGTCVQGDIRLVGGTNEQEGRVEVCNNGAWGTVCDDGFGTIDANVACGQLGFSSSGATASCCAAFGQGTGDIVLDDLACTGTEASLFSCGHGGINSHNCGHGEDVGVTCLAGCDQGSIRLVGGASTNEGRVEVCNNNAWGTVCDDSFGTNDANVACRQLGYSGTGATFSCCAAYGQGTGDIVLDDLACTGSETSLFSCGHNGINSHNCGHGEDVGVTCIDAVTCVDGNVRLVGGSNEREGRVEVCNNNAWGTVCDDSFDVNDATVVCRQLGFSDSGAAFSCCAAFGQGTGLIVLDDLACTGTETSLFSCSHNGINSHNCGHGEDVGVTCLAATCVQGDIRLVDGSNEQEGRVEVCDNGAWGTVCDDGFGTQDANVVCRQLGYSGSGATFSCCAAFGQGTGSIVLDDLACTGTETSLFLCSHNGLNSHNCGHSEDVGVTCIAGCVQGTIRLVGGTTNLEGRVEVCNNNEWGTVCDDGFGVPDANVACRQLGFSDTGAAFSCCAAFGQGTGSIVLDDLGCSGTEASLFDCSNAGGINVHNCGHSEDVGITCQVLPPECTDGEVRLVGGLDEFQGRVEVCDSGAWGTVCDDAWDISDANVVCGQLGYGLATSAPGQANFGQGTGAIVLDQVSCTGSEASIFDCPHGGLNVHDCSHFEDAGVICAGPICTQGDVRLVGGSTALEGRVEVCNNNAWGTVCDDSWGIPDGNVVCSQLGYGPATSAPGQATYGQGTGDIVLDELACTGTESSLFDCTHNGVNVHNCAHSEDAGVVCSDGGPSCTDGELRLVGGTYNSGRVEICDSGAWGTICDDFWSQNDGDVACRQLGFPGASLVQCCAAYGPGSGNIVLDDLGCTGSEASLTVCPHNGLNNHNCAHTEDAGVICEANVRLIGGSTAFEGRVEVYVNGTWGTVCDDSWGLPDANVVCNQLGYGAATSAPGQAFFGQGTGAIVLDDLACVGTEASLFVCSHSGVNVHNCVHGEDAGAVCEGPTTCTQGDVRLVGGATSNEGRVEVCNGGAWGTVCDDSWDVTDASIVCTQLGFAAAMPSTGAPCCASFGQGTGDIVLDDLRCTGSETSIFDCPNNGINIHNCGHSEDAGAVCITCIQGDVRLVGGTNEFEGRVEVCDSNAWGTVCDDSWDVTDGSVVCLQLGYGGATSAPMNAFFGQGTGAIVLDDLACAGTESSLFDCPHSGVNVHNCAHFEDAGVVCSSPVCVQDDIRLVGGTSEFVGRVEVCNNNQWGTVCDDSWDNNDAAVVCRQLGYLGGTARSFAAYGAGVDPIWLDNVACTGSETTLVNCPNNGFGIHNCVHSEDASVDCTAPTTPPPVCVQGDIRLVGGADERQGRVEVCDNNAWGTVCDDGFGAQEASVACIQLGFPGDGATAQQSAAYGQGTGSIVLDDVVCTGTETSIFDCSHGGTNNHNCAHSEDVGITCQRVCNDGDIRLVNGGNNRQGRVELCDNEVWGTVCDDFWDDEDAGVVCFQLGYGRIGTSSRFAAFGQGTGPILIDDVGCAGTENRLIDCSHIGIGTHNCAHSEDAGATCPGFCVNGDVRLVGGSSHFEGRVEVCMNGEWGTVCDDSWDDTDAGVVCGQLGFTGSNVTARSRAFFGQGTGTILVDDVMCTGTETRLVDCPFITNHNCGHSEDAGVTCPSPVTDPPCTDFDLRLVGGNSSREGRVEICMNNVWGTICDDLWDAPDASVVCAQLGLSRTGAIAHSQAFFGQGTGSIFLDDVRCNGDEASIEDCSSTTFHNCAHFEDAGVTCIFCEEGGVRLVNGPNDYTGRVEVCYNQQWGTVCDDFWSTQDANVACQQAGYSRFGATAVRLAAYGQGTGPIVLDNLQCTGTEETLFNCTHNGVNIHNCAHSEDAGAICNTDLFCAEGDVRIVNGPTVNVGLVEVCVNEEWGTICDDNWDSLDAGIVCAQRGFSRLNATAIPLAQYGQGTGPILLDELRCVGTEGNLLNCPRNELGVHDCSHFEDASVDCRVELLCQDGDVRLAGDPALGANMMNGRVEVCHQEEWGTICDDSWSNEDATVVCRQLGFSDIGATAVSFAAFGQGTGPILLDDVQCTGNESNIFSCPSSDIRIHNCAHFEDAGVRCQELPQPCQNGDVRLVDGMIESEGRVEFCQNEVWGTVCDDFWSIDDANVVCHQLGYVRNGNNVAHSTALFGPGTGDIFLDDVFCTGNENRLDECPHNGVGNHNCVHGEDAGVTCQQCIDGAIRLVNGASQFEGRVELCVGSVWGTVCDDSWDDNDAMVACRQAGFLTEGATARRLAFFSQGTGAIVLDDLQCVGTESSLFNCTHSGVNIHNCVHAEDAGVTCPPPSCENGDVRLQGGATIDEGRVEVCNDDDWFTFCDTTFSLLDASVVCRQLGFSRYHAVATTGSSFGPSSTTILVDNTMCIGNETTVTECSYAIFPNISQTCSNNTEAGVMCRDELVCEQYAIRLVGGTTVFEGRVELCIDETWNTVCADSAWTNIDANIACRQAGYAATGATALNAAFFGQGVGPIHADDFGCLGTESRLFDCPIVTFGLCLGGHSQDAGVRCNEGCTHGDVRLSGGSNENEGRVEVCVSGSWGTVCDDFWDANDAAVVCAQLGLDRAGAVSTSFASFGQGTGDIHLDDVMCTGSETRLIDCTYTPQHNCIHLEDAGVVCQGCVPGAVRLANGMRSSEGRVEVCMNTVWGTVCDDGWGLPDATVVCRQLGFSVIGAIPRPLAFFGAGASTVPIFLDDVDCIGTEGRLVQCPYTAIHNCVHNEDSGVTCSEFTVCNDGGLRLVGGSDRLEGRLEVCMNEVWGTVCDDQWDDLDAGVACRQLGFSRFNATAYTHAQFGPGSGPIYLDNVQCAGPELRLEDCFLDNNASECTHDEDASLRCSSTLLCQNGELRLVDGTNQFEGRVELCYNETWGTICDSLWSEQDANVACRQLGYQPNGAVALSNAFFGQGTGIIWLDNLICLGDEERLLDCFFPGLLDTLFCGGHGDDAGLRCMEGCVNGNLRLADGSNSGEGRVEVCLDQHWGTVCQDQWDDLDASVVCKQLGFSRFGALAEPTAAFGPGTGTIHLDNVACIGSEDSLTTCVYDMDSSDCSHLQDAGVTCVTNLRCQDGDLRLGGTGTIAEEGRVEICLNETWGTICDNNWDNNDAAVACRVLGFSRFGAAGLGSAFFGLGTGEIFLDNVGCTGTETSLLDCSPSMTTTACSHSSDAGVRCNPAPVCQDGEIRLITPAGFRNNSGRVEVCLNEQWGSVCDDNWGQMDANVACRQLGFSRYDAVARVNATYGQGGTVINLDNLDCTGDEPRLIDCPFPAGHDCTHAEDAGVDCSTVFVCEEGAIRLVGGSRVTEGRAEICINETWSTICDSDWSLNDANVFCQQLGYLGENAVIYNNAFFGEGTGPIGLTRLRCSGTETNILDCPYEENTAMCTHSNDASLTCQEVCTNGGIRLVDGTNQYEGRVEVCLQQQWGTVCDDLWGTVDAGVACKQLGFSEHNATAISLAPFGQGTGPIWLDNLACLGFEDSLFNCTYDAHTADCAHFEDAGLRCQPCSTGEIRLEGGSTMYEGRVEVCRDQTWGTICDDGWSSLDATVVCRHLGYSGFGATAFQSAHFGQGVGPIYLDDVACGGLEIDIFDCTANTGHNCDHTEDAGVMCNFPPVCNQDEIRLQGGQFETEGRVEICHLETWNTVCDNLWSNEDASVVCKQIGFSRHNAYANTSAVFGEGTGPIYASDVICNGEEDSLTDCQFTSNPTQCTHSNDAGITCSAIFLCRDGDLRLVDGPDMLSGRVEVCDDETWGTVCDDFWSNNDADVTCRQLGFAPVGATPQYAAPYGQGAGPILLDVLICTGQESRLVDCSHAGIGNTDFCIGGHASDAGIICGEVCISGDIRLVNGNSSYEGRIEVCKDQAWGTVCDDFWSEEDANVACRQAGFSGFGAVARSRAFYGQGVGLIHLDDLMCTGFEQSLFDCTFDPTHNCLHSEDAGVVCQPEHICDDGEIRLCDETNYCGSELISGRVEICMDEQWTTICSNLWSLSDGIVACTQLGFSTTSAETFTDNRFGIGTDPPVLGGFTCSGSETNLTQCPSMSIDTCATGSNAAVQCQRKVCSNGDIRLVGGIMRDANNNNLEGRVEFCWNEEWGTICDNDFDFFDAAVICRQAGFSRNNAERFLGSDPGNTFGQASVGTDVFLDNLGCDGNEPNVLSCPYTGVGGIVCPHTKDSAVRCVIRPAFPSNVVVTAASDTSLSISWNPPAEYYSNLIKYSTVCNDSTAPDTTATSIIVTGLNPFSLYRCCVEAVYSDPFENTMACGTATTLEGIPGAPINLRYDDLNATTCGLVTLRWDPPSEDERNGLIISYEVRVNQNNILVGPFTASTTWYTVSGLACCQNYDFEVSAATSQGFGPSRSHNMGFRTLADLSNPVEVFVTVISFNSFRVGWLEPTEVTDQHTPQDTFTLRVTRECQNRQQGNDFFTQAVQHDDNPLIITSGQEQLVPYRIILSAVICESQVIVYNATHFTEDPDDFVDPVVTSATRYPTNPTTALVTWESTEATVVDLLYYAGEIYDSTQLVRMVQITSSDRTDIDGLDLCTTYWFVARAATCGAEAFSTPYKLELQDATLFTLAFDLSDLEECNTWTAADNAMRINAIEQTLNSTLYSAACRLILVDCFAGSTLSCSADDQRVAIFSTTLVGNTLFDSETQEECLVEWSVSNPPPIEVPNGEVLPVVGSGTQGTNGTLPTALPTQTVIGGLPGFGIALIIVAILVLIIIVLVLVAVILLVRRRPAKQTDTSNVPHHLMDDQDDATSRHSIGIVENPLYAEQEGFDTPSYAALSAKEKEAEAEFGFAALPQGQDFSINFDPPGSDDY